ncbi:MAG: hypothetical protein FJ096_13820 [Deltaproteobacteria bacterium]|nr:hypothetical protein [Deltaproteobacteria bacterium]
MVGPARVAWLLNFEVDREFANPGYTPSRAVLARTRALPSRLGGLVRPGDVVLDPEMPVAPAGITMARAWCPTPRALTRLARLGLRTPAAPSFEVLRHVNSRRFSADLGQTLPGACFVEDEASLRCAVDRELPAGARAWLLKSAWSTSGSGQRAVRAANLEPADLAWARHRLGDGLQVEPWMDRVADLAIHGHLAPSGLLSAGAPCVQQVGPSGAWLSSVRAEPGFLPLEEAVALHAELERVGRALAAAGYVGPFNVDAFRYVVAGEAKLNVRCEINARYTMGWAAGMGDSRPDLEG